jgi:excisionase family DNA binding protein
MNNTSKLLTPEQVADILQIHVLTVYNYIRKGKFEAVRLGRTYRIDPEDLERFVQSNKSCKTEIAEKNTAVELTKNPFPLPDKKLGRI